MNKLKIVVSNVKILTMSENNIGKRPELPELAQSVQRYSQEDILWSKEYQDAFSELGLRVGADNNPTFALQISMGISHGIAETTARIGQLAEMRNPQKRKELAEKIQKGELPERWFMRLASWNIQEDPCGIQVLKQCRQAELDEIHAKRRGTKNEIEEIWLLRTEEAVAKGQDLIINYYKKIAGIE